jgi:hypothetical protein
VAQSALIAAVTKKLVFIIRLLGSREKRSTKRGDTERTAMTLEKTGMGTASRRFAPSEFANLKPKPFHPWRDIGRFMTGKWLDFAWHQPKKNQSRNKELGKSARENMPQTSRVSLTPHYTKNNVDTPKI